MKDMHDFADTQQKKGYSKSKIHNIFLRDSREHYEQLAQTANIEKIWDVYPKIASDSVKSETEHPFGFRDYRYTIIDDKTFVKEKRCST